MTDHIVTVPHNEEGTQFFSKNPQHVGLGKKDPQSVGSVGDSLTQISAGPAAELYSIMDQILALYNQIQAKSAQLSKMEVGVQSKSTLASANFAIKSADKQADQMKWQATQAGINGGLALFSMGAQAYMMKGGDEMQMHEETAKGQEKLLSLKQEPVAKNIAAENKLPELKVLNETKTAEITGRKNDLIENDGRTNYEYKGDHYPKTKTYAHTGEDKSPFGTKKGSLDQDAVNAMNETEYKNFKEKVRADKKLHEESMNRFQLERQNNVQFVTTLKDLAQQFSTTGTTVAQSKATHEKGQYDAAQQETQYTSQSAAASTQMTVGQLTQFFSKVAEVIAAMKQGAMAYAQ